MSVKLLWTVSLIFSCCLFACAHNQVQTESSHSVKSTTSESEHTLGLMTGKALLTNYPKFLVEFESHEPDSNDIRHFKNLNGYDIVVLFGTWCHDSQREVPRLLKLIELSGVQLNSLQLVAVNEQKQLPEEYRIAYELKFTPTFYVVKNKQILATLVEKPKQSITKDLLSQILF